MFKYFVIGAVVLVLPLLVIFLPTILRLMHFLLLGRHIKKWASRLLTSSYYGKGPIESKDFENAEYAYQIRTRSKLFRSVDVALILLRIRAAPRECTCEANCTSAPLLFSNDDSKPADARKEQWKSTFTELVALLRHDDSLNWQKFHYVLVIYGVLLTGFVFSFNTPHAVEITRPLRIVLSIVGAFIALGADHTFQEGLRCLRGHRRKLMAVEKNGLHEQDFLFQGCPFNQRDVLEVGPIIMMLASISLLAISLI